MPHPHGTFGWIDLSTDDLDGAESFYTSLFDLQSRHAPIDDQSHYVMLVKAGRNVAGIGAKPDPDMPSAWQSYIYVDDVDEVVGRVAELGGSVMIEPFDVLESGRMSMIADPTGAVVSLWQAKGHGGGEVFNEHGTHTWNELITRDVAAARAFYAGLVGWTYQEVDMGDGATYHVAIVDGKGEDPSNGGIMDGTGIVTDEVPNHWDVYFNVDDTDRALAKATELGGSVVVPPMDAPVGRFAYLADPGGARFYVMTPAQA